MKRVGLWLRIEAPDLPFPIPLSFPLDPWPLKHSLLLPQSLFVTLVPVLPESWTGVAGVDDVFDCVVGSGEDVEMLLGGGTFAVEGLAWTPGDVADTTTVFVAAVEVTTVLGEGLIVVEGGVGCVPNNGAVLV